MEEKKKFFLREDLQLISEVGLLESENHQLAITIVINLSNKYPPQMLKQVGKNLAGNGLFV